MAERTSGRENIKKYCESFQLSEYYRLQKTREARYSRQKSLTPKGVRL
jgi:hypothetical protein